MECIQLIILKIKYKNHGPTTTMKTFNIPLAKGSVDRKHTFIVIHLLSTEDSTNHKFTFFEKIVKYNKSKYYLMNISTI